MGGSGAGLLLQGPDGQAWSYALHFEFNAFNNEAKYEMLIIGLRLAEQMRVRDLEDAAGHRRVRGPGGCHGPVLGDSQGFYGVISGDENQSCLMSTAIPELSTWSHYPRGA